MKRDTPEFVKRWNRCATPTGRSWRVDETYWRKIRGKWVYLPGDGSVWTDGGLHARCKARCGRNVAVYRSAAGSAPGGVAVGRVVGLACRLHAEADPVALVVLRARAVLAPGVFVDHVVADGAVLVVGLG